MAWNIGIFLYEDFQILDAAGPISAFELAGRASDPAYHVRILAREDGPVRSSSGVVLTAEAASGAGPLDTLIVIGGEGVNRTMADAATLAFFRHRASEVRRLCSVCSGAMLLAEAGLLDGRRATTHWRRVPEFTRRYPAVRAEPDSIFVRDGYVWTSAGISAGIDLTLALIAEDLGEAVARGVAREMVVYYRRPGGQSQFSALLAMGSADDRFTRLLGWIRDHIGERLTVEVLAAEAAMSARHFSRAFREATGMSPAKAIERLRLEIARERVEAGQQPVETIARATGFHDPERMRRAFLRAFGMPPQAMRRAMLAGTRAKDMIRNSPS